METKIVAFLIVVFILGLWLGSYFSSQTIYIYNYTQPVVTKYIRPIASNVSFASINIPAVDNEGKGVVTTLWVQVMPGSGKVLIDVDVLLYWPDTQDSIRIARDVATNITGINISKYDLIYNIYANASLIGGPSAGAAITLATIAALENKSLNESVMITGSINHDGTIGQVGEILAKAKAAKDIGASKFLVPLNQAVQVTYKTREYCRRIGLMEFCTTETYPEKVNVSESVGIEVKEVGNIQQALKYFMA